MTGRTITHYRVLEKIGAGGMGVVYAAEDIRLGRRVALKFLSDTVSRDRQAMERLLHEARAVSSLNHPHICTLYDVGEYEGCPFLVMELLDGDTLRQRMCRPLDLEKVIDFSGSTATSCPSFADMTRGYGGGCARYRSTW